MREHTSKLHSELDDYYRALNRLGHVTKFLGREYIGPVPMVITGISFFVKQNYPTKPPVNFLSL